MSCEPFETFVIEETERDSSAVKFTSKTDEGKLLFTAVARYDCYIQFHGPSGSIIYSVSEAQGHHLFHRHWFIHDAASQILYSVRNKSLHLHDKYEIYKGQVHFHEVSGEPEDNMPSSWQVDVYHKTHNWQAEIHNSAGLLSASMQQINSHSEPKNANQDRDEGGHIHNHHLLHHHRHGMGCYEVTLRSTCNVTLITAMTILLDVLLHKQ